MIHTQVMCEWVCVFELLVGNSDIHEQCEKLKLKLHAAVRVAANAKATYEYYKLIVSFTDNTVHWLNAANNWWINYE